MPSTRNLWPIQYSTSTVAESEFWEGLQYAMRSEIQLKQVFRISLEINIDSHIFYITNTLSCFKSEITSFWIRTLECTITRKHLWTKFNPSTCLHSYPEPIVIKPFHPKEGAWEGTEKVLSSRPIKSPHLLICTFYSYPLFCSSNTHLTPCIYCREGTLVPSFVYT